MEKIGQTNIWKSNLDECLISLCKKAGKKLSGLARLANFLSLEQRKLLMKSLIESQLGYCPLTWD